MNESSDEIRALRRRVKELERQLALTAGQELEDQRQTALALQRSEEQYRTLFEEMLNGCALHEIVCDEQGEPIDYVFLNINPAFEQITGLKREQLIGHRVLEVLPKTESYWIERYGKVALGGGAASFSNFSQELGRYYQVTAFSPQPGQFAVIFADVTEERKLETEQAERERLQGVLEAAGAACHEVSQPVQGIAGCLFEVQMSLPLEHPAQELLREADDMVKRVREILVQLSSITRYATRDYIGGRRIIDLERSTEQGE